MRVSLMTYPKTLSQHRRRALCVVVALLGGLAVLLFQGCSSEPRTLQLPVAVEPSFVGAEPNASPTLPQPLQSNWAETFGDSELNLLIDWALAENFSLQVAWDRLAQAQAVARQTGASLKPQVELNAGYNRSRQVVNNQGNYTSVYSVGIAASYEIDLWSRIGSTRQAALLDAQASRDAVDTAAISLTASVASVWYQLAEAQALVRIAQSQIETNKQVLDIVTTQFRQGLADAADVLRQRRLVAATEADLISAQQTVELLQYTLSVLLGVEPRLAWQDKTIALPELTALPYIGIPSEVLWRRPDVRQAYRQVQAADLRLAAAIANQYPRLSLSGSVGTSTTSISDLFDDWIGNLAANAVQPLFDGDQRQAAVALQRATLSETIHTWSQTILEALQEVETALTQERQQQRLATNLQEQFSLAQQAYDRLREAYLKGQTDYINVLDSLQSLQSLERQLVASRLALVQRRIDLYRSIAGPPEMTAPQLARIEDLTHITADQIR